MVEVNYKSKRKCTKTLTSEEKKTLNNVVTNLQVSYKDNNIHSN